MQRIIDANAHRTLSERIADAVQTLMRTHCGRCAHYPYLHHSLYRHHSLYKNHPLLLDFKAVSVCFRFITKRRYFS